MARRPPPPGAPRWGLTVIVAGSGILAVLLPIAVNRGVMEGTPQPAVDARAAAPKAPTVPPRDKSATESLSELFPPAPSVSPTPDPTTAVPAPATSLVVASLPSRRPAPAPVRTTTRA